LTPKKEQKTPYVYTRLAPKHIEGSLNFDAFICHLLLNSANSSYEQLAVWLYHNIEKNTLTNDQLSGFHVGVGLIFPSLGNILMIVAISTEQPSSIAAIKLGLGFS
jgi:hypothetical protein